MKTNQRDRNYNRFLGTIKKIITVVPKSDCVFKLLILSVIDNKNCLFAKSAKQICSHRED